MIPTTQIPSKYWPKKFDEFKGLIYIPLDLPEPPEVDMDLFIDWVCLKSPKIIGKINSPETGEKIMHFEEKGIKGWGYYPWVQVSALHHGYSNTWIAEFDKLFPDVVDYIHLFPYNILSGVTILLQKSAVSAPLHLDSDDWLGMRFYLHNEVEKDVLYFHPRRTKEDTRIPNFIIENDNVYTQNWKKYFDVEKKIYTKHPVQRHAWTLTSTRAVHGIDAFEYEKYSRATFLVHAHRPSLNHNAWNSDKLYDLLVRSIEKYSDYAIWWTSPGDS